MEALNDLAAKDLILIETTMSSAISFKVVSVHPDHIVLKAALTGEMAHLTETATGHDNPYTLTFQNDNMVMAGWKIKKLS